MTSRLKGFALTAFALIFCATVFTFGQRLADSSKASVELGHSLYSLIPISATAAVNNQVTLTIPAPDPGKFNYICKLVFRVSQDGTATATNNAVTTSTNFNSFAFALSAEDVAQKEAIASMDFGNPATGCAKSVASGTATTFVGPAAITNAGQWWGAGYYQAP